jgi:hypothetical protein
MDIFTYYQISMHQKLLVILKEKIIGKTIGFEVYHNPYIMDANGGNGMGHLAPGARHYLSPYKITKINDVGIDVTGTYYFEDINGNKYQVLSPFQHLNVDEILEDLNTNKPEVSFQCLTEIKVKKEMPIFKSMISSFLKESYTHYNKTITATVAIKVDKISYFTDSDGHDKFEIIDSFGERYVPLNPLNITTIVRTAQDPYGEEDWDDEEQIPTTRRRGGLAHF